MSDEPFFAGSIHGIRAWQIEADLRLSGLGNGSGQRWSDGGRFTEAICLRHHHPAPRSECSCGLYALHTSQSLGDWIYLEPDGRVSGVVEAQGRVELHRDGFRAQLARPTVLFSPTPHRASAEHLRKIAAAAERYDAQLVELPGPAYAGEWARTSGLGLSAEAIEDSFLQGLAIRLRRTSRISRDGARLTAGVWPEIDIAASAGQNPWRRPPRTGVRKLPGFSFCRLRAAWDGRGCVRNDEAFAPGSPLRLVDAGRPGGDPRVEVWDQHGELELGPLPARLSAQVRRRIGAGRALEARCLTRTTWLRHGGAPGWLTIMIAPAIPITVEPEAAEPPTLPGWDWHNCRPPGAR
jgi:hypothetical protein